jgi:hypothetical protein
MSVLVSMFVAVYVCSTLTVLRGMPYCVSLEEDGVYITSRANV